MILRCCGNKRFLSLFYYFYKKNFHSKNQKINLTSKVFWRWKNKLSLKKDQLNEKYVLEATARCTIKH